MRYCDTCRGTRKLIGMGMLEKICHVCNGIGYMKEPEVIAISIEAPIPKRKGRKPSAKPSFNFVL